MAKKKKRNTGLPPGSVVFTGQRKVDKISIHYVQYNAERCRSVQLDNQSIQDFHRPVDDFVQWYDIRGLHDTALIGAFGEVFSVHPLAMEDIVDPGQRPKVDEYKGGILIAAKAIAFDTVTRKISLEQVSFYLGQGFLLTFQENEADLFTVIRQRIELSGGRIRESDADYLLYALLDYLVDQYVLSLDKIEEVLESMEAGIYAGATPDARSDLYELKQELNRLRKVMVPSRELFNKLVMGEPGLLTKQTLLYLRDLRDHQVQALETTEGYRDGIDSLQDLYLSELSFRMNNVMQVLAIVSTIFIPLTFLTGLYGMNFKHIPGQDHPAGFLLLLLAMGVITVGLAMFFRRKGWL